MELIDIKLDQVNEWLLLRKKIDKNWSRLLKPIETKQNIALNKLQENKEFRSLIPENLSGFVQAKEIFAKLLNTSEANKGKTLFGNYSSESIYEWESLLKLYEKNNLYLADCAKHLLQVGVYEVPSLKATLQSYEKQIKEYQNKEQSISDEISKKNKAYKDKCKNCGIEGNNLQYELKLTTRKIPEIYEKIIKKIQSEEFFHLFRCYSDVTLKNHGCEVSLPTVSKLISFDTDIDIDKIKNKYCALIVEDSVQIVEDNKTESQ